MNCKVPANESSEKFCSAQVLPFIVETTSEGQMLTVSRSLELSLTLWPFFKRNIQPQFVSKLYWPFFVQSLDDENFCMMDMLGIFRSSINEYESPECLKLLEKCGWIDKSQEESSVFLRNLRAIQECSGYSPKPSESKIPGLFATGRFAPQLINYLHRAVGDAKIASDCILSPQISAASCEQSFAYIRQVWMRLIEDMDALSVGISSIAECRDAWQQRLERWRKATTIDYDRKLREASDAAFQKIEESEELMDQELYDLEIKLSPEIALLEAELARGQSAEDRGARPKKSKRKGKTPASSEQIEAQLGKVVDERTRLLSRVREHYGKIIAKEHAKIASVKEDRDAELKQIDSLLASIADECVATGNTLSQIVMRREKHRLATSALFCHITEPAAQATYPKQQLLLLPFWTIGLLHRGKPTVEFILPSFVRSKRNILDQLKALFPNGGIPLTSAISNFSVSLKRALVRCCKSDSPLRQELWQKAQKSNILVAPEFVVELNAGLADMVNRKWIKSEDVKMNLPPI